MPLFVRSRSHHPFLVWSLLLMLKKLIRKRQTKKTLNFLLNLACSDFFFSRAVHCSIDMIHMRARTRSRSNQFCQTMSKVNFNYQKYTYVGHTALSALAFEVYTFGVSHTLKAQNIIAQASQRINRKIHTAIMCVARFVATLSNGRRNFFLVKWHIWDHNRYCELYSVSAFETEIIVIIHWIFFYEIVQNKPKRSIVRWRIFCIPRISDQLCLSLLSFVTFDFFPFIICNERKTIIKHTKMSACLDSSASKFIEEKNKSAKWPSVFFIGGSIKNALCTYGFANTHVLLCFFLCVLSVNA